MEAGQAPASAPRAAAEPKSASTKAKRGSTPGPPKKKSDTSSPAPRTASAKAATSSPPSSAPVTRKGAEAPDAPNLRGEWGNLALLCVLYTLQGIPLGLGRLLPLILTDRKATYSELATFSVQSMPFCLKLLWAPLVDSVYIRSIGRRKTWMLPSQLLIGLLMLYTATQLEDLLGDGQESRPAINTLTGLFLAINFLCATQDIAVDGWALTMLRKENSNYQATCNSAGQAFGRAVGYTLFTLLVNLELVTLPGFIFFMGILFLVVTAIVAVFKEEKPLPPEDEPEGIRDTYMQMLQMMNLKPVQLLFVMLVTWKVPFMVCEPLLPVKLKEYGVDWGHIAYIQSLVMPMSFLVPILAARWTGGKRPLKLAFAVYPVRLATGVLTAVVAYYTPASTPIPWVFYSFLLLVTAAEKTTEEMMFSSQMAFFAHISDPALGGTYMTLLNTMANLGGQWPPTAAYLLVDVMTCKNDSYLLPMDGFYGVAILCTLIGVLWLVGSKKMVRRLQIKSPAEWRVARQHAD